MLSSIAMHDYDDVPPRGVSKSSSLRITIVQPAWEWDMDMDRRIVGTDLVGLSDLAGDLDVDAWK